MKLSDKTLNDKDILTIKNLGSNYTKADPPSSIVIILAIPLILLIFFLNSYAVMSLYNWFLPKTLGVNSIDLKTSCGAVLLSNILCNYSNTSRDKEMSQKESIQVLVVLMLKPLFALLFGYIISSCM